MRRLGVGREALRQTVEFATAHGWVVRNAGHGHPLRPDFVLTESGRAARAGLRQGVADGGAGRGRRAAGAEVDGAGAPRARERAGAVRTDQGRPG
ncbi:MAG: hypothetical protein HND58_00510 [Planctomycetota bacterium]|nr:MAG: hypothetical protein HND58_00510 [Planctomycetota bacterium]